ncbi:hypothetical protein ACHAWF_018071 [Thalassiosira exigua]
MASADATVLVGTEDTTPQPRRFGAVREFDEDEEGFIDVGIASDGSDSSPVNHPVAHDEDGDDSRVDVEMAPLMLPETHVDVRDNDASAQPHHHPGAKPAQKATHIRSRRAKSGGGDSDSNEDRSGRDSARRMSCLKKKRSRERLNVMIDGSDPANLDASGHSGASEASQLSGGSAAAMGCGRMRRFCAESSTRVLRTTVSVMNFLARVLLWGSFVAMVLGVVWYSRELKMNGTDPHLIAWFSAGAFVLLGFPISMCGIILHLKNYYQPNVQCYVVRILWMVPIYSIESWLCLRFHTLAIYIETLRDCYESYVLYSFFQYLIEVLGGEDTLVLMLKDKSPTRGAHIWGLGWCMKPWIMGQPVSRRLSYSAEKIKQQGMGAGYMPNGQGGPSTPLVTTPATRPIKRVQWTSPFFVKCKFGVLQYVLLKFVSTILVMVLEMNGLYKEGDFTPRGGYLYICILTNLSQCWALYCLVFFYYALKNELGPIRPVGKFLSVKALVFFTWWQSLGISILFDMGMIPHYASFENGREWTSEAVAKGLQDWLICIEMFCFAIVHTFVFPHTDYLEPLGIVEQRAGSHLSNGVRRLGRRGRYGHRRGDDKSASSKSSGEAEVTGGFDLELGETTTAGGNNSQSISGRCSTVDESDKESTGSGVTSAENPKHERQGFVRALLDSTLPRDVLDESVGIFKGDFNVEKKTLLHHAATSDEYDLFSKSSKRRKAKLRPTPGRKKTNKSSPAVPDSITAIS